MRWLDSITDSMDMNFSKLCKIVEDRRTWPAAVHGVAKSWTRLRAEPQKYTVSLAGRIIPAFVISHSSKIVMVLK